MTLPIRSAGVRSEPARAQAVVPELPPAAVRFEAVAVSSSAVLPGDGCADCAKPFRLREDVFVTGCVLAYLLAESQAGSWSAAWSQRAIAAVTRLQTCSRPDPLQADTMILVAGALAFAGDVIGDTGAQWPAHQQRERERWLRDRPILAFGKEARRQRALRSWRVRGRGPSIPAAGSAPD